MRIDKFLAHTGFGTRKTVKQLLKKKAVYINQEIVTKGDKKVNLKWDSVYVNGEKVVYEQYVYLMLHKPTGVVSATRDNRDKTVIDLVPQAYRHYDLFPVGRLDKDTEGLLLLTNDGQLNHVLTSPKKEITKTYYAKIDGHITDQDVTTFKRGVELDDGYITKTADLHILTAADTSEIMLDITEGKFHQVKRMFQAVHMSVIYLKRLSMGPIALDESLQAGKIRPLDDTELAYLNTIKEK